ncbi:PKS-AT domain-containing protein [Aphelenchoides bicaudatus]|nr:PKS-AT domain-containing protein [Aphelenchoides bicaudatus]
MRPINSFARTFVRGVRRRATQKPASFIEDATTFADTHTVLSDPFTPMPYPEKQLFGYLKQTQDEKHEKVAQKALKKEAYLKNGLNFDHIPIEKQIFLLFPGQGEQHVGMGKQLKDSPLSMELFERASEYLKYDLWDLCRAGPKSKLDLTLHANTAVFVTGVAAVEKMRANIEDFDERLTNAAGFGVGEFCSLVAGGILSFDDALRIVDAQARLIHECNQLVSCQTFAVQVKASSQLDQAISEAKEMAIEKGEMPLCETSAYVYCGLKMMGASRLCKKFLEENSERFQFKIVKNFPIIGAPYTGLMRPAQSDMDNVLKGIDKFGKPHINVYSNYLGKVYPNKKQQVRMCMFRQFSSPLKWEQIMQILYRFHQNYKFPTICEVGSSKQLSSCVFQTSKKAHQKYNNFPC